MSITKIKRPRLDHSATYRLELSGNKHKYQFVSVKYDDDAEAIDLLLKHGMNRQARIIMDIPQNHFTSFE